MVDEVLGELFKGVLVSDFHAAYNHYPGLKQRCWVHLLRDIHDLKVLYPKDAKLVRWAGAVHKLYIEGKRGRPAPILMGGNGGWPKGRAVGGEIAGPLAPVH